MTTTLSQPGLFAGTLVSVDYDQESAIAKAIGGREVRLQVYRRKSRRYSAGRYR